MTGVRDQLDRINSADANQPRKRIAVLGAGMAGLAAAYELKALGHDVQVIEATSRVGGRVWTKRFGPTSEYHELGAMRIPKRHDYTRHYIELVGLSSKLRRFVTAHMNPNCFYDLRGQVVRIRDAGPVLEQYPLSAGELLIATKRAAPALFGGHIGNAIASLSSSDRASLFGNAFMTDRVAELESQSLGEFLDRRCDSTAAKELIGASTGLEVWWDKALTMFLRDEIIGTGDGLQELAGGLDQLPDTLADKLGRQQIEFNTAVVELALTDDGVCIRTQPTDPDQCGSPIQQDSEVVARVFDTAICTIPFAVLRGITLSGLSHDKMAAIRNLNYASSTKVLLYCRDRFWERGNEATRILGGASLSDGITRATYYPSDHAEPERPAGVERRSLYSTFKTDGASAAGQVAELPPGPGVLVGSYCWGQDARRLGSMDREERAEVVTSVVSRFHPMLPDHVEDHDSMFWDEFRWARGAFCFLRPGELRSTYPAAIRAEGRLHFAGEHCSLDQGWIQGALMSALRAVEELVSR